MTRTGHGDHVAFTGLCSQLWLRVFRSVHRLVRDRHQAEEVTQETFLQIWQQARRYDPSAGSALAWILALAHARAVDRIRSAQASRLRDGRWVARHHQIAGDDPAEGPLVTVDRDAVHQALAQLSVVQRESIQWFYFGGLSYAEISTMLHIPLPTVKTRIRDGLIKLRKALPRPL